MKGTKTPSLEKEKEIDLRRVEWALFAQSTIKIRIFDLWVWNWKLD